jgi:hypothetical protein
MSRSSASPENTGVDLVAQSSRAVGYQRLRQCVCRRWRADDGGCGPSLRCCWATRMRHSGATVGRATYVRTCSNTWKGTAGRNSARAAGSPRCNRHRARMPSRSRHHSAPHRCNHGIDKPFRPIARHAKARRQSGEVCATKSITRRGRTVCATSCPLEIGVGPERRNAYLPSKRAAPSLELRVLTFAKWTSSPR